MKKSIFKTVLPLLAVALVGVVFATSCKKDKNEDKANELTVSDITFTPCHGSDEKGPYNPDSVAVSYSNGTVYVTHYNLWVNCGWEDIEVRCRQSHDTIFVKEIEVTPVQADCECETDNSFSINNVKGQRTMVFESCYPVVICQTYNFQ